MFIVSTTPTPGQRLRFHDGNECTVTAVRPPLASGRFTGMSVCVCIWADGREGTFMVELCRFTVIS